MSISLGADPEFFLSDRRSHAGVIPCVGLIPGTKGDVHDLGDGFGVHEDNVTVELNVPVTTSVPAFGDSIEQGKRRIIEQCLNKDQGLLTWASYAFEPAMLTSKQAQTFGCEPDFDAYNGGKTRHIGKATTISHYRYAGGHIHIGGEFNCPPFVAALFADLFISLPALYPSESTGHSSSNNGASERMKWYGKPGIFRQKAYGIEYRTPSNYWCHGYESACSLGERAMRLGHWLENTSATGIRDALKAIPWIELQDLLTSPPNSREDREDAVSNMLRQVNGVVPV